MSDVEVRNNPENSRYEAWLDGERAGLAAYETRPGSIVFTHTEVDDRYAGQGVGGALAKGALDDVRAGGGTYDVIPLCSFIKGYIDKHPEYADLVHEDGA